ncbi:hypothetical protein D5086_033972 [Populus alba]|uniref:Uncharacterized protein n=1 Tax=Populus alba TaxID=43335 RepID=A0ACC4AID7_POPAL
MYASATCSTSDFFRKRRNALTRCVSRHSEIDAPVAEIQLPMNLVAFAFRVIPLEHVCFRYLFYIRLLLQTAKRFDSKRFDSVSFAAFRLRCPRCRNSVAIEFRVIPLDHVCFRYLSYIRQLPQNGRNALTRLVPQTAKCFGLYFFRKWRNALTMCVSRYSEFDCPVAEIQLPLNFVAFEFRVIPLEHVCFRYLFYIIVLPQTAKRFDSHVCFRYLFYIILLPQTEKRFDSVSFAAFRLRFHGCRNSIAFEFRVIPLEHVCFGCLFYIRLVPQTAKCFDYVSFALFRIRWPGCRNSVAIEFRVIPLEHVCFPLLCPYIRLLPQNSKRFNSMIFAPIPTSMPRLPKFSCL